MTPKFLHQEFARGKWFTLPLVTQLAHIGSEVARTRQWQHKDDASFRNAFERALDLFDLTLEDSRWRGRRGEIALSRELFCGAALGENRYHTSLEDLDRYFLQFAVASSRVIANNANK